MFRCNSSARSSSMANLSSIPDIVNQEEQEYQDLNNNFESWNIPKIPVKEIYKSRLIQVAIKPLSRTGLNSSVLLSLRDSRFIV
ncbi:hypothetical protein RHMOL_Rhmol01G0175600 [Rhododendron molle]|uniref:Uncharacterized protein n=1 Tax=Rhododendron molle TaxID=49168 RepID=A0ACC0Q2U3_RHOML|nr:hypothetical protein RHMOL_Rhmol01G0175600 [Rhododendron molle]